MNDKYYKRAKNLTLIPIIVLAVTATCLTPLMISYLSTGSDVTAVACILIWSLSLFLTSPVCLVIAIVGTVSAARSIKDGMEASRRFHVVGTIEIIFYGLGVLCAILFALFMLSR